MNEKSYGLDLTQGRLSTLILRFAWPFLASSIVSVLYGAVDLAVVGQFTGQNVISGVATGSQVMNIVFAATNGIGTGGTVLIGRRVGERDDKACARAAASFMITGAALAVFITLLLFAARGLLLTALATPAEALPSAANYVFITTMGAPFLVGFNMLSAMARGMGNARTPSIIAAIGCVVNIVLDYLLVGVWPFAEAGAAIATVAAQIVAFVIMVIWQYRRKFSFPFTRRDFRIDWSSVGSVFKVGLPLWLQDLLVSLSFMIITGIVNKMGVVASASVGIVSRVFSFGGIFPSAFGSAIAAITAQNIGAGKRGRALKSLRWGIVYSLIICGLFCVYCQVAPQSITALFVSASEPDVIAGSAAYLRAFGLDLLLVAVIFPTNSYLSGCGKSAISMAHSMIATFGVRIPLSILASRLVGYTLNGQLYMLGLASPIASVPSIIISYAYIFWQRKKERRLLPGADAGDGG